MKVNKITALRLMLSITMIIGLASCSKKSSSKNSSRATGWNVDRKKASDGKKQIAGPGLVFVEGGTFTTAGLLVITTGSFIAEEFRIKMHTDLVMLLKLFRMLVLMK